MRIDIVDLPIQILPAQLHGKVAVVFDILRATSSMVQAVSNGARNIIVYSSIEEARQGHANDPSLHAMLVGEIACIAPDGFRLGNSPPTFTPEAVKGMTLHMSTTNGTKAILASRSASAVFIASRRNLPAIASHLMSLARDVVIVCAGTNGKPAGEDQFVAGELALMLQQSSATLAPSCESALLIVKEHEADVLSFFRTTAGGQALCRLGLDFDVQFCASNDNANSPVCVVEFDPQSPASGTVRRMNVD